MNSLWIIFLAVTTIQVSGHGSLYKPVSRNSAWRFGFNTPPDYDDNALYCGGMGVQWDQNDGKCGACGDNYQDPTPRQHEDGGTFGTGTITGTYSSGDTIDILIHLTASHLGSFTFGICNLDNSAETEECFQPVMLGDGSDNYSGITEPRDYTMNIKLPDGLTCNHCSFRWHYSAGNSWGDCGNGTSAVGCGPQETFRNCADITIN